MTYITKAIPSYHFCHIVTLFPNNISSPASAAFRSAGGQAILLWNFVKMYGHGYAHLVNVWHRA
jgi:hypothetical protein